MRYIFLLLGLFLLLSCLGDRQKSETDTFTHKDSVMIVEMYSFIDTLNGHWRINISKDSAMRLGVSDSVFSLFEKKIEEVNVWIDSIKARDSSVVIGYNFPK